LLESSDESFAMVRASITLLKIPSLEGTCEEPLFDG
jgi:hypothetical protein